MPQRNVVQELADLLKDCKISFGLRQQGHLPKVREMLEAKASWDDIGKAIGWQGDAVRRMFELEDFADRMTGVERTACAALVRAAGCVCDFLLEGARAEREGIDGFKPPFGRVVIHDPRCPHALAAEIEARA